MVPEEISEDECVAPDLDCLSWVRNELFIIGSNCGMRDRFQLLEREGNGERREIRTSRVIGGS